MVQRGPVVTFARVGYEANTAHPIPSRGRRRDTTPWCEHSNKRPRAAPYGASAANLEFVADPTGIGEPVDYAAPVVAGFTSQSEIIEGVSAAVTAAAQVLKRGGVMPAFIMRRVAQPQELAAVAAPAFLEIEQQRGNCALAPAVE
jgi:hypothetical protein